MAGQVHVFTVGTSVLRNFAGRAEALGLERVGDWHRLAPDDPFQERLWELAEDGGFVSRISGFAASDPRGCCAELNAFTLFVEERGVARPDAEIVLLHTDTGNGRLSATVLREALGRLGYRVSGVRRVEGFGLGAERFQEGLANLMDEMASVARGFSGRRLYLNASGGFKPEAAFAVIAASLLGFSASYYVHEAFRELVVLPSPPLVLERRTAEKLSRLGGLGWSAPTHFLLDTLGWSPSEIGELVERGLAEVEDGVFKVREWARRLLG